MTALQRWATFNLVGAVGMAVQLALLALFRRLLHGHYLLASAAALEGTLLHNFAWHTRYTWRDCGVGVSRIRRLVRFHLANGAVSFAGTFALVPVLVCVAHLRLLLANAVTIVCCSLANFWVAHGWAFSQQRRGQAMPK